MEATMETYQNAICKRSMLYLQMREIDHILKTTKNLRWLRVYDDAVEGQLFVRIEEFDEQWQGQYGCMRKCCRSI